MTSLSVANPVSYLRAEYEHHQALFEAQPAIVQRFIEAQASQLADAVSGKISHARFTLPDRVVSKTPHSGELATMLVPGELREQTVGSWARWIGRHDLREDLRQRLSNFEQSPDQAVNTSAALIRHATAIHMIHHMLPSGRAVSYAAEDGEQIPNIPVDDGSKASAITTQVDAIAEEGSPESGRGELQVPFAPAARRFFIPQWVALDQDGQLLVSSVAEADAQIASMQRYVTILHKAVALAPYMVADDEYQKKRCGMLGQLVNQGRALAAYETGEIIRTIKERAEAGKLNRGLSLSVPYFDDQELMMESVDFEVIPAGRIMFLPGFVVRAAHGEQAKAAQDTRMSPSTRKYLLQELRQLEDAFTEPAVLLRQYALRQRL